MKVAELYKDKVKVEFHLTFRGDMKLKQDAKVWISSSKVSGATWQQSFSIEDLGFLWCPRMTGQICKIICLLFSWDYDGMC